MTKSDKELADEIRRQLLGASNDTAQWPEVALSIPQWDSVLIALRQSSDKVLVPREPTMEMRKAGRDAMPVEYEYWQEGKILHSKIKPLNDCAQPETIYRAMFSASEAEGHHE